MHTVETEEDRKIIAITPSAVTAVIAIVLILATVAAIIPIVARRGENGDVDGAALFIIEFVFLALLVSCEDAEPLVRADSRVAAHGLIVDRNPAVHSAARNEISQDVGNIVALGTRSIVGMLDPPVTVLRGHTRCEDRCRQTYKNHRNQKPEHTTRSLHRRRASSAGRDGQPSNFTPIADGKKRLARRP
ncbi:MAG: hypothetical protein WB460_07775 [Candidatus Acidiferrales bacterium]